ncbi:MAG: SDR family oxidoreductase [Candidatus Doudnabacteria bacterium]|nr:SDR family oxidoreductase [Candidatus Doudnabacteria bacterium]
MHILITGAAQGIGAAIAAEVAKRGHTLTLVDVKGDVLTATAEKLRQQGAMVTVLIGDLTSADFISQLDAHLAQSPDKLDVLINNAAVAHPLRPFQDIPEEDLDQGLAVNVKAPFKLAQIGIKYMLPQGGGTIINVASRSNIYGYIHMAVYAATKAAITSFTGTIALENKTTGIRAFTIIPGRTNTQMQAQLRGQAEASAAQPPEYVGEIVSKLIDNEIPGIESGDSLLVSFGEYRVMKELDKGDLHKKMTSEQQN